MAAKSGRVGGIYKQSIITSTFVNQASTLQADNKTVIITDTTKVGFVRDLSLFTVKKGGTTITAPYEIHFDRIIFREAQSSGVWTISGTYAELEQIGGGYEWSIDLKHNVQDKSAFGDSWETKLSGIVSWSASAKRRWIDDNYIDIVDNGLPIIVRLFTDIDTFESYVGYGQIDGIKKGDKVDGIVDAEISFAGDGSLIWCNYSLVDIP
jgi:hypothetical protein